MDETRDHDAVIKVVSGVATLIIFAGVIGIPYVCDRAYRRWMSENHPLARPRARIVRARTGYHQKRDNMSEVAEVFNEILAEVARATSK
jgi:hypothetical protein